MITQTEKRSVTASTTQVREFTIKADGKAFRVLIDGLYENKIQSIVREIWSNALDGHVQGGNPERPFEVVFPSLFSPVFSVRDYGSSLSHEDIMGLYCTVFSSTKEDTNDAVGKFGLGSKSPFAYTDTFSVTAVLDGEKRYYSALIAESGVPQIHFMGSEPTDEERGIEVSFPIENNDVRAFRNAAHRVSHGFDVKPVVKANDDDDATEFTGWPELEVLTEGTGWKLLSGAIEDYTTRAYARMGCVLYPINVEAIPDLSNDEKRLLSQSTMIIDFEIGELEMSASRESLSYGSKDPTAASIKARVKTIVAEMVASFTTQYDAADTYWDACILYREHTHASNIPQAVRSIINTNATYKGKKLTASLSIGNRAQYDVHLDDHFQFTSLTGKLSNQVYRFDYYATNASINPSDKTAIFIEDLSGKVEPKRASARIKMAQVENKYTQILWIKYEGGKESADSMIRLLEVFDGATITDINDLPEITRQSVGGASRRPVQVREYRYTNFDTRVDLSPEEFTEGGYYVPLERMAPVKPSAHSTPEEIWDALKRSGAVESDATLYGAPKSLWKLFKGAQWINVYDLANKHFQDNIGKKKSVVLARLIEKVLGDDTLRKLSKNIRIGDLSKGSAAHTAIEYREKYAAMTKPAVEGILRLARATGKTELVETWVEQTTPELQKHLTSIDDAYPMLSEFDTYYLRNEVDKLTQYVQMCDKAAAYDSLASTTTAAVAA
jgi:hypothetical protein